jgi:chromosome partitioning protein
MPVVAVVNRKGGSGKSTLATHLAAYCAQRGLRVLLGDVDRQQSTQTWLRLRQKQPSAAPGSIVGWAVDPKNVVRPPAGIAHVVLDTPGGLRGFDLARVVMYADAILMPVCNSVFDRESAAECYAELQTLPRIANGRCKIAAVGMRLDGRTKGGEVIKAWAQHQGLDYLGALRDTQAYVRCVERGLTLFDLPAAQVESDLSQWRPILDWLKPVLFPPPKTVEVAGAAPKANLPPRALQPLNGPSATQATPPRPSPILRPAQGQTPSAGASRGNAAPSGGPPGRAPMTVRLGRLLDALPIPRFLQRDS